MHSLIGTFIKEMPIESSKSEGCDLYPVKIVLPPNKSRILYFKDKNEQIDWHERLKNVVGYANLFDFYTFEADLGKGQFGLVKRLHRAAHFWKCLFFFWEGGGEIDGRARMCMY